MNRIQRIVTWFLNFFGERCDDWHGWGLWKWRVSYRRVVCLSWPLMRRNSLTNKIFAAYEAALSDGMALGMKRGYEIGYDACVNELGEMIDREFGKSDTSTIALGFVGKRK